MRNKCKKKRRIINNDDNFLNNERRVLIDSIEVNEQNARTIFEEALSYTNNASDDIVEYQERDIKHLMVNCIRHTESTYEDTLKSFYKSSKNTSGRVYMLGYNMIKNTALEQISQKYPYLENECKKQKTKVKMIKIKTQ